MAGAQDLFLGLTPEWVIQAVEFGGFLPTGHCLALHCLENRVYDLKLEDDSHIVVKFYRPGRWSKACIEEEHAFLHELRDVEIPVCAPYRFEDGSSVHEVEGIYYAVWPRTGGRSPSELNDEQAEILGRLIARIHNVGACQPAVHRLHLDAKTYAEDPLSFLLENDFIPTPWAARYADVVGRIAETYNARTQGVPVHRIHGDCHLANLLNRGEGWFFLDFDDFLVGPAVQDLWLLVPGRDSEAIHTREVMVEAYRQFRPFEGAWLDLVELLRALRIIHYSAWIAKRWHDPSFPRSFPQFCTEAYWQAETIALEESLRTSEQVSVHHG